MNFRKKKQPEVDVLRATQAEQKEFDAGVAALGKAETAAEMTQTQAIAARKRDMTVSRSKLSQPLF